MAPMRCYRGAVENSSGDARVEKVPEVEAGVGAADEIAGKGSAIRPDCVEAGSASGAKVAQGQTPTLCQSLAFVNLIRTIVAASKTAYHASRSMLARIIRPLDEKRFALEVVVTNKLFLILVPVVPILVAGVAAVFAADGNRNIALLLMQNASAYAVLMATWQIVISILGICIIFILSRNRLVWGSSVIACAVIFTAPDDLVLLFIAVCVIGLAIREIVHPRSAIERTPGAVMCSVTVLFISVWQAGWEGWVLGAVYALAIVGVLIPVQRDHLLLTAGLWVALAAVFTLPYWLLGSIQMDYQPEAVWLPRESILLTGYGWTDAQVVAQDDMGIHLLWEGDVVWAPARDVEDRVFCNSRPEFSTVLDYLAGVAPIEYGEACREWRWR
jgi:hypothetical protein